MLALLCLAEDLLLIEARHKSLLEYSIDRLHASASRSGVSRKKEERKERERGGRLYGKISGVIWKGRRL